MQNSPQFFGGKEGPFREVTIAGGGLAGCEAAWQLAGRGVRVVLYEMRPHVMTPAHVTGLLGELVCSNSLKSTSMNNASGILKREMEIGGSLVLQAAFASRVPAGSALAVDRRLMGEKITHVIENHPLIKVRREVVEELPEGPAIIATGPLTGGALAERLSEAASVPLYFYDAIAPIVETESIDLDNAFFASRWEKEASESPDQPPRGDYINCPLSLEEYEDFIESLLSGEQVPPHSFEEPRFFEGCLPIEVMASRGSDVLRHGPMRPVGLRDPNTGRRPYAVVQLRAENKGATAHNMVGFQTRLKYGEQKRIFRKIPALRNARFLRLGSIHRNTYLRAPDCLEDDLVLQNTEDIRVAGLLCGVEGYMESTAMGWLVGIITAIRLAELDFHPPPPSTATGALYAYIRRSLMEDEIFTPTNMNLSLFPEPATKGKRVPKKLRRIMIAERAEKEFKSWLSTLDQEIGGKSLRVSE